MNAARGGGREQAVLEDREVEHRRAGAALDQDEQRQQHGRRRPGPRSRAGRSSRRCRRARSRRRARSGRRRRWRCRAGRARAPRRALRARAGRARPRARRASASGTLNQKTQCQEIATSAPPSTGPSTRPTAATIVLVPIARPSCSLREGVGDERGGVGEQERAADRPGGSATGSARCRRPRSRRRARPARTATKPPT